MNWEWPTAVETSSHWSVKGCVWCHVSGPEVIEMLTGREETCVRAWTNGRNKKKKQPKTVLFLNWLNCDKTNLSIFFFFFTFSSPSFVLRSPPVLPSFPALPPTVSRRFAPPSLPCRPPLLSLSSCLCWLLFLSLSFSLSLFQVFLLLLFLLFLLQRWVVCVATVTEQWEHRQLIQ